MLITEIKMDLFKLSDLDYTYVHCISQDLKMGAGIALPMNKKYNLRNRIRATGETVKFPTAIYTNPVINMITKKKYFDKPTMDDFIDSLLIVENICRNNNIKKLAMPRIGCGLDKLKWPTVRLKIEKYFSDIDIEITVCNL